ncbi:tetratricopeptide repeat protein [Streptomyces sp. NPDC058469]|uniref:tetratricopeptide repeat protein n=1 Tax=Streptomyces sp. NPDC058469 TaxID=3346514 RepID=UPI0036620F4D
MPVATAALPAVPAGFTGRDEDLARLFPVLDPAAESELPVVICAMSGLGGIGKTSLALCAAHKAVRDGWFPGGTLFVDLQQTGRMEEAMDAHTRARDLYQTAGDRHLKAITWNNLGNALQQTGQAEEANDAHTRARDLFQTAGDRHLEATAWNNLGGALRGLGRVEEAVEAYEKALDGYREFDSWYETGRTLSNLAIAHKHAARPAEARTNYLHSAAAYTRANAPTEAAVAQSRADALT